MTAATAIRTATDDCVPPSWRSNAIQSRQASGATTNEIPAMTAVVPSANASGRHSRRTANHRRPTPGVTLVSSTNAQVPAQRNPSTIAAASSRWICPIRISWLTGRASTSSAVGHGRASHMATAARNTVQPTWNTSRGTADQREDLGERRGVEVRVGAADGRAGVRIARVDPPIDEPVGRWSAPGVVPNHDVHVGGDEHARDCEPVTHGAALASVRRSYIGRIVRPLLPADTGSGRLEPPVLSG